MKYLLLIIFFLLFLKKMNAQQAADSNRFELGFVETYVIKAGFVEKLLSSKSPCMYKEGTECNLYKIKIIEVLNCASNTVFDSTGLIDLKFIIAPVSYSDSLFIGKEYVFSAMPSSSNRYIAMERILDFDLTRKVKEFYYEHAHLSGLITCKKKKKDLFENFIINQSNKRGVEE